MKMIDKLRAFWSKRENDIMLQFPMGYGTKSDGAYLAYFFNEEFCKEMEDRGYDIKTMKFSIEPQKGHDKFRSQRERHVENEEEK